MFFVYSQVPKNLVKFYFHKYCGRIVKDYVLCILKFCATLFLVRSGALSVSLKIGKRVAILTLYEKYFCQKFIID